MISNKLGFIDTSSGEREDAYKALKTAVYSFKFVYVHRRKLSKDNIIVIKTSILVRINNLITVKVKYTTKAHLTKGFLRKELKQVRERNGMIASSYYNHQDKQSPRSGEQLLINLDNIEGIIGRHFTLLNEKDGHNDNPGHK